MVSAAYSYLSSSTLDGGLDMQTSGAPAADLTAGPGVPVRRGRVEVPA